MKIILEPDGLINKAYIPYLFSKHKTRIFFGGSASGKSAFRGQETILDVLSGRNYLIVRKVANTLKHSVWNECIKAINQLGVREQFIIGKSELTITAKCNNKQILFGGLDDVEKVKSITPINGALTDIWIEEATEIGYDDYKQLTKRIRGLSEHTKRITFTFNPVYKTHWIYKEFFNQWKDGDTALDTTDLLIVKTTHWDNDFLEQQDHDALEDEDNEYYYEVYTLGNWGVLGDVIFKKWKVLDLHEKVDIGGGRLVEFCSMFDNIRNGLDFGFAADPAAPVKCNLDKKNKKIYIINAFYLRGYTNSMLADEIKPIFKRQRVNCDSAEAKSIQELRDMGIDAHGAEKGQDSVVFGIQWLQGYELVVDVGCQDLINELNIYQWKKDKHGNTIRQPIDKNNHCIDALRYALCNDMIRNKGIAKAGTIKYRGA
jgi:phage terminase large subunit